MGMSDASLKNESRSQGRKKTRNVPRNNASPAKGAPMARAKVQHSYHDRLHDPIAAGSVSPHAGSDKPRGGVTIAFPEKLHEMLYFVEEEGLGDIVSWQPHGRCFVIHCKETFVKDIMPRFFHQSKITSFQRQLNLYGFVRLTAGQDRGGYYHEMFLRSRPDLARNITRTRIKGNGMKAASSPDTEPNFYSMEHCPGSTGDMYQSVESPAVAASATVSAVVPSIPTSSFHVEDNRKISATQQATVKDWKNEHEEEEEEHQQSQRQNEHRPKASEISLATEEDNFNSNSGKLQSKGSSCSLDYPFTLRNMATHIVTPPISPEQIQSGLLSNMHPSFADVPMSISVPFEKNDVWRPQYLSTRGHHASTCSFDIETDDEEMNRLQHKEGPLNNGDAVYFEGHKFRYLDRLDIDQVDAVFPDSNNTTVV